jgi:tetratricopeptide (TPR) repeat protein
LELSRAARAAGKAEEADRLRRQALRLREELAADSPKDPILRVGLASLSWLLSGEARAADKAEEADRLGGQALRLYEELATDFPRDPNHRSSWAGVSLDLSLAARAAGKAEEADRLARQALRLRESWQPSTRPTRATVPRWVTRPGISAVRAGGRQDGGGDRLGQQALRLYEKLALDFPVPTAYRSGLATMSLDLSRAARAAGKTEEADRLAQQALQLHEKLAADFPDNPAHKASLAAARFSLANETLDRSTAVWFAGKAEEADRLGRQALRQYKLAADGPPDAYVQNTVALLLATFPNPEVGDARRAVDLARQAVAKEPQNGFYWETLAVAHALAGDWKNALHARERTLELGSNNPNRVYDLAWLLATCPTRKSGTRPGPSSFPRRNRPHPDVANNWHTLGIAHYRAGDAKAAVAALEKARQCRNVYGFSGLLSTRPPAPGDQEWFILAMAYWRLGEKETARGEYDRGVLWMEKNSQQIKQNRQQDERLHRFRAEAAALLGVSTP